MRKYVSGYRDKKYFRTTSYTRKKININPAIYRGGIRL